MLTPEQLKKLRELANEVLEIGELYANGIDICTKDGDGKDFVVINGITIPEIMDYFFAVNPQTILELLDEIEQLRAQAAVMREALEDCVNALKLCPHDSLIKMTVFPYDMINDAELALHADAGREMLERVRKLERVAEATKVYLRVKKSWDNRLKELIDLKTALAALEKRDDSNNDPD